MEKTASVVCTITRMEPVDQEPYLVVDIQVACEICGVAQAILTGHHLRHLRPIVRILQEVIDTCPEETDEGVVLAHYRTDDPEVH